MFTSISHCETHANSVHGKFYKSSCIKWRLFVISWWSRVEILAGSRFRVLKLKKKMLMALLENLKLSSYFSENDLETRLKVCENETGLSNFCWRE
jgi:hypothetical protein